MKRSESKEGKDNYLLGPKKRMHISRGRNAKNFHKTSLEDLSALGFHIGRELGEGSYCKVRSATYGEKDLAVKIITRDRLSVDFKTRFLPREIEILSKVDHRHIVKVYKIFSYPRRVYIFMELMERGDLLCLIRRRGRLTEYETCRYFYQMVTAIQYLHSLNIAHRDLKCENIMINDYDEIKIIDFGFCRVTVNKEGRRELSRTFCGSTAYAAPEVLQGVPYNPMMYDVWSLGCVLFIMVTGTMPFDDTHIRKMVTCQLKRQIRYPSTFDVKKDVKTIIARMLEPDVTKRATMSQVDKCKWFEQNREMLLREASSDRLYQSMSDFGMCERCSGSKSISRSTQTRLNETKNT